MIDTNEISASRYPDLESIVTQTVNSVNASLVDPKHAYHLKSTKTQGLGDAEMLKALAYFVIPSRKAAFTNEASKDLLVNLRAYYHLLAIENYLRTAGIESTRTFELAPQGADKTINQEPEVKFFDDKILLSLKNPRQVINYVPFPVNKGLNYNTSNELTAIIAENNSFYIQYGNRFQTRLYPEYLEFSNLFNEVTLQVDSNETTVPLGTKVKVKENFLIPKIANVCANVIGFDHSKDESNILVSKRNIQRPYSLDMARKIYRVEFYKLRGVNLQQFLENSVESKLIENAKIFDLATPRIVRIKDKFIGPILVEFE